MPAISGLISVCVAWLVFSADPPQTVIKPATPPSPGTKHYVVQVRILEVDDQGRASVVATPTVQTTGAAAGVTLDSDRGKRFEFHFSATEAGAPSPLPLVLSDEPALPKPIAVASSETTAEMNPPRRVTYQAAQQPRKVALREIGKQAGVKLVVDPDAAAAAAPWLEQLVTCDYQQSTLEYTLKQLLGPTKLGYRVEDGLLWIGSELPPATSPAPPPLAINPAATTAPRAEALVVMVYDVSDLVEKDVTSGRPDFEPLIQTLKAGVLTKSWETSGASIRGFDSTQSLVIRQTAAGHDAIARWLQELRAKSKTP